MTDHDVVELLKPYLLGRGDDPFGVAPAVFEARIVGRVFPILPRPNGPASSA